MKRVKGFSQKIEFGTIPSGVVSRLWELASPAGRYPTPQALGWSPFQTQISDFSCGEQIETSKTTSLETLSLGEA